MNNDKIKNILINLNESVVEIDDSAVVLSDGLVIASKIKHNFDEDKLGTLSAAIFGLANKAAIQFEKDKAQHVIIKCNKSYIAIIKINDESALFVDFKASSNVDMILQSCINNCKLIEDFI